MNTFVIPMMFLQCLTWEPHDGETIRGFRFEQPVTIVANGSVAKIDHSEFIMSYGCYAIEASNGALVTDPGVFMGGASPTK